MTSRAVEAEALLTPAEVAALFRVDPKTVTRWAKAGKLTSMRTPGGHHRYRESEVRNLLGRADRPREAPSSDGGFSAVGSSAGGEDSSWEVC